jgi:amino acid adenylation domain-containing protein
MERVDHQTDAVPGDVCLGMNLSNGNLVVNPEGKPRPLSASERRKLLVEWNQTRTEYPRDACVHHLFEAQVERSPEAVAVECEGHQLTYQELNVRANQLAFHLRGLGVGPDKFVGICVEPSVDMVVGLLGILKAGGAYVPLDPAYPKERLVFMVKDTAMEVLLTQEQLLSMLPSGGARLVCVDAPLPGSRDSVNANPAGEASADSLAYVIYTSGSTGIPKGVMIPHRGLVNYLVWSMDAYQVGRGKGSPVHSSISFDLTITGLFAPLLAGRCVYVVPPTKRLETLATELRRNQNFSLVKITPAHLELLGSQLSPEDAAGRTNSLIIGGDTLLGESLKLWQAHAPETVLVNEYGPTETVVGCCVYFVPKGTRLTGPVPIGRPIANTQLYVLDPDLQPVPIGDKGELYIGGDGVARGYLNLPEQTARSFIPNPFAGMDPTASPKLYKTGDLVRYRTDGNLEFLGRVDHQVKIRGFRIEPSEIESVLAAHPHVQGAVVVAQESRTGDKSLTAYIVWRGQVAPSFLELRQFLKEKLPDYMLPAEFVTLVSFPLTPNGKVDRHALPPPGLELMASSEYVAPRNEIERRILDVWREILHHPRIGLHDSFFELGGNSLLAVRLVTEINRILDTNLDAVHLFGHPTIATLARSLQDEKASNPVPKLIPLDAGGSGPPIFFIWPPMELFGLVSMLKLKQPFYVSEVPRISEIFLASARHEHGILPTIAEMAAPHTSLIRNSGFSASCVLAGFSYGGVLAFEIAHQLRCHGMSVEAVFLFDSDMKMRNWEHFKLRIRRTLHDGPDYFTRKIRERSQRKQMQREAQRLVRETALDSSDREAPWEIINHIWIHALRNYRLRRLHSRGFLFRAHDSLYNEVNDYDGCLGWSGLFAGGVEVVEVPGGHFSMWKEPDVLELSRSWESCLEALRQKPQSSQGTRSKSMVGSMLTASFISFTSWKCILMSQPDLVQFF